MVRQGTWTRQGILVGVVACAVLLAGGFPRTGQASPAQATAPPLGTATSFAVLAGSAVTNTGPTIVSGDLGVSPGTAVSGFPPGIVTNGTIHAGDAVAAKAQSDATTAYNNLAGQPCSFNLTGQDLGGKTLTPGVYCFSTSAQLTGTLTLDGQGNPNSVFIFQIGSTLTTASAASVLLINGAQSCNVFWQVGSSATLGTNTTFAGSILALTSITLNTSATINGRALALNGAVTMDSNRVSASQCSLAPTATATVGRPTATATTVSTPTSTISPATSTVIAATSTAVAGATSTAVAGATSTAVAAATNTAVAGPTSTAIAAATSTAVAGATSTAIAAATNTAVLGPTSTAVAGATSTAIAAATNTAVAGPTSTAIAAATSTAVAAATSTAIAAATNTAVVGPTSTAVAAATATSTPKPVKATPIKATPRPTNAQTGPTAVPIPSSTFQQGFGGTAAHGANGSRTGSTNAGSLARGASSNRSNGSSEPAPAQLPHTGGGSGGPLPPLVFLGAVAIAVGRLVLRVSKR